MDTGKGRIIDMLTADVLNGSTEYLLALSDYASGVYLLTVEIGKFSYNDHMLIEID